jgi:3-methyladenine DNA glycosylase AlkD
VNKDQVLDLLRSQADPAKLKEMERIAIKTDQRFGLSIYDLRRIARGIPHDHELALELWESGFPEARVLASMIDIPAQATDDQLEGWVKDFDSWDVCDQVCDNLFQHTRFAWEKVYEWSTREEEFVKRSAYTLLACLAFYDKEADEQKFIETFLLIKAGADDSRNYVKKAVNWALRNIGKRNLALNRKAVEFAEDLLEMDNKTASWIARNALRELCSEKIQQRLIKKGGK